MDWDGFVGCSGVGIASDRAPHGNCCNREDRLTFGSSTKNNSDRVSILEARSLLSFVWNQSSSFNIDCAIAPSIPSGNRPDRSSNSDTFLLMVTNKHISYTAK